MPEALSGYMKKLVGCWKFPATFDCGYMVFYYISISDKEFLVLLQLCHFSINSLHSKTRVILKLERTARGHFVTLRATFIWPWKTNVRTERKQMCKTFNWLIEQKQTSVNFHWLSERACKQRHLSMELSGKRSALRFDVIRDAVMWLGNRTVYCPY